MTRGGEAPTVAVVLAAGAGTRFTGPTHKLDAVIDDRTVLGHAVEAALTSGIGPVVVVTQPGQRLPAARGGDSVSVAVNAEWARGQASSLQVGITAAASWHAERIVVGLGDQPGIAPGAWRAVAAAGATAPIAVATYMSSGRGHPVSLHRDVWGLLPADGDGGARRLMRLRPELVREVPCDGSAADIDTLEDLERWQSNSSTNSP